MHSWLAVVFGAAIIAVLLGVLFQAAFWSQPVTPELALLFLIVGFLLALGVRALWARLSPRRGGD